MEQWLVTSCGMILLCDARGPVNELGVRARQLRDCPPVKAAPCLGACSGSSGLVLQVIDR